MAAASDIVSDAETDPEVATPIVNRLEANATGGDPNDPDDEQADQNKIDQILKDATPGRVTKGRTNQYEKDGGFTKANQEFDALGLKNVKDISVGRTGQLSNDTNVTVHSRSSDGRPIL